MAPLKYSQLWRTLAWLYLALIIIGSLMPLTGISAPRLPDKFLHGLFYAILMFWFAQVYLRTPRIVLALLFVASGIAIEYMQESTGHRRFERADMMANTVGVALGWALVMTPAGRLATTLDNLLFRWRSRQ